MQEYLKKLEYYCSYQERCHQEVLQKLYQIKCPIEYHDQIIVHLIENNYLNEERFSFLFTQSKLHQKQWGKIRLEIELKQRNISNRNIQLALKNIDKQEYNQIFEIYSEKIWNSITEKNKIKKLKKFIDYWIRKGFESDLVYQKGNELLEK
jgi:regulatory protein